MTAAPGPRACWVRTQPSYHLKIWGKEKGAGASFLLTAWNVRKSRTTRTSSTLDEEVSTTNFGDCQDYFRKKMVN